MQQRKVNPRRGRRAFWLLLACVAVGLFAASIAAVALSKAGPDLNWSDRRPIGALFLASNFHSSISNPRGWFNSPALDVRGQAGQERFHAALMTYADRSIAILKRAGSQGMIVWDLEGQEYPHKTTYIGDPRLLARLAPEAPDAMDEFFGRFRSAGLAVGMTLRPQQLSFSGDGKVSQVQVWKYERLLLAKIDYAHSRWGATLFYIDSNGGPFWPAEAFRLRRVAQQRPGVLLIPEHHDALYYGFSAPYGSLQRGASPTSGTVRMLYPNAFQVLNIADFGRDEEAVAAAYRNRDVLLFPAWFDTRESRLVERLGRR